MCTTDAEFRMSYLHFDLIMLEAVLKCHQLQVFDVANDTVYQVYLVYQVYSSRNLQTIRPAITFQHSLPFFSFQHDRIKMKV